MEQYDNIPKIHLRPPVFLMRSALRCYMCGKQTDVYCLASNGFVEDGEVVSEFTHYSNLAWVPDKLEAVIRKHARGYFFDYIKQRGNCYFINHCKCRAKLSEHQVHNQAGSGFSPVNPEQARQIILYQITDTEGFAVCATPVIHDEDVVTASATIEKLA